MKGNISVLKRLLKDWWVYDLNLINEKHNIFAEVECGFWTTIDKRVRFLLLQGKNEETS